MSDTRATATRCEGPPETYVDFGGDGFGDSPTARRPDYLSTRGCCVDSHRVVDPGEWPSDHRPVVADVRIE